MGDGMAEEDNDRGQVFTLFMFLNNFTFPATWVVKKHNNHPGGVVFDSTAIADEFHVVSIKKCIFTQKSFYKM